MRMHAVMSNGDEIDITEDYEGLKAILPDKPLVELSSGEMVNFRFCIRVRKEDELPDFKGGDPYLDFMNRKNAGLIPGIPATQIVPIKKQGHGRETPAKQY